MKPSVLSVLLALAALAAGIVIGRYTVPPAPARVQTASSIPSPSPITFPPVLTRKSNRTEEPNKAATPANAEDVITAIKNALGHLGSRRTFAEFGKLSELINEKNLGEVLAFAESLPKAQEKNMVLSMLLGRWAEFDHHLCSLCRRLLTSLAWQIERSAEDA